MREKRENKGKDSSARNPSGNRRGKKKTPPLRREKPTTKKRGTTCPWGWSRGIVQMQHSRALEERGEEILKLFHQRMQKKNNMRLLHPSQKKSSFVRGEKKKGLKRGHASHQRGRKRRAPTRAHKSCNLGKNTVRRKVPFNELLEGKNFGPLTSGGHPPVCSQNERKKSLPQLGITNHRKKRYQEKSRPRGKKNSSRQQKKKKGGRTSSQEKRVEKDHKKPDGKKESAFQAARPAGGQVGKKGRYFRKKNGEVSVHSRSLVEHLILIWDNTMRKGETFSP